MEQFSLEKYLENPSRKVVTRRGNPVRIICTDRKHGEDNLPIVFLEQCHNGEFLLACRKDGRGDTYDTPYDLFFADEKELIDSLPEEHDEDLEEEINRVDDRYPVELKYIQEIAHHFAEWQKEKHNKQFGFLNLKDCKDAYNKWKSTQDNPSAALAWVRACEWQKQQVMKDAVDGEVVYQIGSAEIAPTDIQYKVVSDRVYIPNVKLGDKVKIIIVKED